MNAEPTESESSQLDEMIEPTEHASESEDSAPDFELDDDQLDAVLESLLLVVDSPAEVNQLASVTGTAPERVEERLTSMSAALTARGSGMDLRYAGRRMASVHATRVCPVRGKAAIGRRTHQIDPGRHWKLWP